MVRVAGVFGEEWRAPLQGFQTTFNVHEVGHARALASSSKTMPVELLPFTCQTVKPSHPFGFGIFRGESPLDFSFPLFLFQISLVLVIIHVTRFLLKPLRQPRIVSEVIGGIIVGPSILGHNKVFAANIFPEDCKLEVKTLGVLGFIYFLFVSGVKMDLSVVKQATRKQVVTALFGVLAPQVCTLIVALIMRSSFDKRLERIASIGAVTSSLAITAFPVLYPVLKELNLLSSEIGRQALTTAIVSDIIGMHAIIAFEAMKQGETSGLASLWYLMSTIVTLLLVLVGARKLMEWVVRQTPEGQTVDQLYIVGIFVGAALIGFLTDMFGVAVANGPLWLGLAIPDGPPLGATVVDRCETIIMEILLPISFTFVGLYTDVFSLASEWASLRPLLIMAIVGYVTKCLAYVISCLFFDMTVKDSFSLGLIMSLRGQVEYLLFIHWMDKEIIGIPGFTLMVLLTTVVTGLSTPLISALYNPTRPYIINKRRTIQHHPLNTELRIIACFPDPESVPGIINLLEVSNPTVSSPFAVSALRLVELMGRASPVFIDHEKEEYYTEQARDNPIHNALHQYQESRGDDIVKVHSFTALGPRRTLYQDICELALAYKSTLIILPFHKNCVGAHGETGIIRSGVQSINASVVRHAPCSVALLVDKEAFRGRVVGRSHRFSSFKFAMLFMGGADAREGLSYVERMVTNPVVSLIVVRFLAQNCEGDNEKEKKLDDGAVTAFWVKNEANERVVYREVVVRNGEETIGAIRGMNEEEGYDLWVVGRKEGVNPVLVEGLSDWSENNDELGIVGDFVASTDFGSTGSVLVVQQQVLRGSSAGGGARGVGGCGGGGPPSYEHLRLMIC